MSGAPHDFPSLKPGGHVCLPYTTVDEKHRAISGFLRDGLVRGERCLYWGTPSEFADVSHHLQSKDVPVSALCERGSLVLADAGGAPGQPLDVEARTSAIRSAIAAAKSDGYAGLRLAGDRNQQAFADLDRLARFESSLSTIFDETHSTCLCAFDQRTTDPLSLEVALCTHDTAILSGRLCPNPFFKAPGSSNSSNGGAERVAWMTDNILELTRARELLEDENAALVVESSRVDTRDSALRRQILALTRAVESRDRLIIAAARWLSRPLPGMCGHLRELVKDAQFAHCRDMLDSCNEHIAAVTRLSAGLDEIAGFLQLQVVLRPEPLDIVAIARAAIRETGAAASVEDMCIRIEGPDRIMGNWDRLRVTRLFHSLISTVREQGPKPNVRLQLEDLDQLVRIRLEFTLPHLPGISESGEHPRPSAYGTAGESDYERLAVRLWPAREIVRTMGGTLGISTWADARVVFTLDLPKSLPAPPAVTDSTTH